MRREPSRCATEWHKVPGIQPTSGSQERAVTKIVIIGGGPAGHEAALSAAAYRV